MIHMLFFNCRQLGSNLVVPGGSKTIEVKGKLIMPGEKQLCTVNILSDQITDLCKRFTLSSIDLKVNACIPKMKRVIVYTMKGKKELY